MILLCAKQNVGNLKNALSIIWGSSVRRTKRQTHQHMHFENFRDSCAQNKTSENSNLHFHKLWDSCAQNKTSEIAKNALHTIWDSCAQNKTSAIFKQCTFIKYGTPVCRTKRRKSQKQLRFQEFWDSWAQNKTSEISNMHFQ